MRFCCEMGPIRTHKGGRGVFEKCTFVYEGVGGGGGWWCGVNVHTHKRNCKFPGKFDPIRVDDNMPVVDILELLSKSAFTEELDIVIEC